EYSLHFTSEVNKEIEQETFAMLREYGMSDADIRHSWNSNPAFRSFPAQRVMADAARYRISQRSMQSKVSRPVPVVQRPGVATERTPEADITIQRLNTRLNTTGNYRDAAALLNARRASRR